MLDIHGTDFDRRVHSKIGKKEHTPLQTMWKIKAYYAMVLYPALSQDLTYSSFGQNFASIGGSPSAQLVSSIIYSSSVCGVELL